MKNYPLERLDAVEGARHLFDSDALTLGFARRFILEVTQRGYRRVDKVFRPARVIVNDLPGVRHAR